MALKYSEGKSAEANFYKALIYVKEKQLQQALSQAKIALENFNQTHTNRRDYVEAILQVYRQEIDSLILSLEET